MVYACFMNVTARLLSALAAGNSLLADLLLRRPAPC